jgi:hypothetical protein
MHLGPVVSQVIQHIQTLRHERFELDVYPSEVVAIHRGDSRLRNLSYSVTMVLSRLEKATLTVKFSMLGYSHQVVVSFARLG